MIEKMGGFCAGFTLCGWRQTDGTIRSSINKNTVIPEWPEEILLFGNTYVAENKTTHDDGYETVDYC